jgi:hypothetical protein
MVAEVSGRGGGFVVFATPGDGGTMASAGFVESRCMSAVSMESGPAFDAKGFS